MRLLRNDDIYKLNGYHLTIEGHQVQAELKKSVYYVDQVADNSHGLLYPFDFYCS